MERDFDSMMKSCEMTHVKYWFQRKNPTWLKYIFVKCHMFNIGLK